MATSPDASPSKKSKSPTGKKSKSPKKGGKSKSPKGKKGGKSKSPKGKKGGKSKSPKGKKGKSKKKKSKKKKKKGKGKKKGGTSGSRSPTKKGKAGSNATGKSKSPVKTPSKSTKKSPEDELGETMVDNATSAMFEDDDEDDEEGDCEEDSDDSDEEEEDEEDEDEDEDEEEEEEEEEQAIQKKKKRKKTLYNLEQDAEVDFETLIKEEFKKLHRQYRLMEDARHAIAGASGKLGKQGKLLERLRDEKEDLLTDLKNARCKAYRMKDKQSINTILEALERYEKYKADITACLLSIAEMESNVDRITQRLVEQKLKVQALYGQSMTVPMAEHKKRILEDKLYHVTTQTDTLVSQNKELKADINMMLKLRGSFYRRMLHIKKVSGKIKQRMGEVVFEATAAYDQRDDWINKINILRERNDKDSKQHVLEIKEFQRVLHHDSKIHEFLAIKNKDRDLLENTAQRLDRKNRGKINELDQLLAAYRRSFKAILSMAKSRDIDTLVNAYLEEEHKNYAMFKFITDLNHETNSLQEDINKIKDEIENLSYASKDNVKKQEQTLSDYDKKLDEATKKLDASLKEWTIADKQLEEFGNLLDEAFSLAGCSNAPIVALLGNQNGMGPHNICLCMKALEHRVTELLFEKGMLEVRKSVEIDGNPVPKKPQLWTQGQKPPPQGGPFKPVVHVTGRVDSEQEDEDNEIKAWAERPIYYTEMKEIIRQSMQTLQVEEGGAQPSAVDATATASNEGRQSMAGARPSAAGAPRESAAGARPSTAGAARESVAGAPRESVSGARQSTAGAPRESEAGAPRESVAGAPRESVSGARQSTAGAARESVSGAPRESNAGPRPSASGPPP